MQGIYVTEVELKRYQVLTDVLKRRINVKTDSNVLGLSYRHTLRLRDRFMTKGIDGLLRRNPPKPPNKKITSEIRQIIVSLKRGLYGDLISFI